MAEVSQAQVSNGSLPQIRIISTQRAAETVRWRTGGNLPPHEEHYTGGKDMNWPQMILDTEAHWDWRNPLLLIPLFLVLLAIYALVGTLVIAYL